MYSVSCCIITVNRDIISIFSLQISEQHSILPCRVCMPARGVVASAFKKAELVYIHCVSKEKFGVTLKGFSCVSLISREAHVSYIENMSEQRRCLVPDVVENQPVDVLFEGQRTPLLVRINFLCDIMVSVLPVVF